MWNFENPQINHVSRQFQLFEKYHVSVIESGVFLYASHNLDAFQKDPERPWEEKLLFQFI